MTPARPDTDGCSTFGRRRTGLTTSATCLPRGPRRAPWALRHESGHPPERLAAGGGQPRAARLVKRLRLVDDRKRYPEIAAQEVRAPIVITGLPRTGSTHLQALLATRRCAVAAGVGDAAALPAAGGRARSAADPRIAQVQAAIDARPGAAALQGIHPYGARGPSSAWA